jgi:hypothetical protein
MFEIIFLPNKIPQATELFFYLSNKPNAIIVSQVLGPDFLEKNMYVFERIPLP